MTVQPFVAAAREYIKRAMDVDLDGSEISLVFVDYYAEHTPRPLADDVIALIAPAIGAYLGEVAIAKFGGAWVLDGEDPAGWRVELEPVELRFWPVGMAAAALAGADVDGYDASFVTRPELMGPLANALAAVPPVDERYFYSLTGRMETLTYVVELLAELERQKQEPRPDE